MIENLSEARAIMERLEGGTVPVATVLEIIQLAEDELSQARGEFTLTQAMEMSGRSRAWFERRLPEWVQKGMARRPGRDWLIKGAVIPLRESTLPRHGFDPRLSDEQIMARLRASFKAA